MKQYFHVPIYSLFLMFLVLLTACHESIDNNHIMQPNYEEIYQTLWLVHSTLDYPGTRSSMDNCRQKKLKKCMQLVTSISKARDQLLQVPHDIALNNILDTIVKRCQGKLDLDTRVVCGGAVTALYYFNLEKDDRKIISTFRNYPDDVIKNIFSTTRCWYYNRSENSGWVEFINSSALDSDHKINFSEFFTDTTRAPFGLMLL